MIVPKGHFSHRRAVAFGREQMHPAGTVWPVVFVDHGQFQLSRGGLEGAMPRPRIKPRQSAKMNSPDRRNRGPVIRV